MMKKRKKSRVMRFFTSSPKTAIGILIVIVILSMTMGASFFSSHDPFHRYQGRYQTPPSTEHLLGTTQLGRDVFAQTLHGGQKSIIVGCFAAFLTVVLGLFFGISTGYFGGVYDSVLSTVINVIMVVPNIVLLLIIASLMGGVSPFLICLIIGLTSWPWSARVLRAQTMSIRNREFVYSAETLGESKLRILFVEIMPNMLSMISSSFIATIIYSIMAHATLEFIGFGDPLSLTWGTMLYNAKASGALNSGIWWEVAGPISGLVLLGTGLTLINFAIDEISNPKLSAQRFMRVYYKAKKREGRRLEKAKEGEMCG